MTGTTAARNAIGELVIVPGYCRGCDRETEGIGTITGIEPAPAVMLGGDCYVIEFGGLHHLGHRTRVLIGTNAKLHPADRRVAPFCEWCGRPGEVHEDTGYQPCREFYRDTGRPATPDDDLSAYRPF